MKIDKVRVLRGPMCLRKQARASQRVDFANLLQTVEAHSWFQASGSAKWAHCISAAIV